MQALVPGGGSLLVLAEEHLAAGAPQLLSEFSATVFIFYCFLNIYLFFQHYGSAFTFIYLCMYVCMAGCVGSSLLRAGFL